MWKHLVRTVEQGIKDPFNGLTLREYANNEVLKHVFNYKSRIKVRQKSAPELLLSTQLPADRCLDHLHCPGDRLVSEDTPSHVYHRPC